MSLRRAFLRPAYWPIAAHRIVSTVTNGYGTTGRQEQDCNSISSEQVCRSGVLYVHWPYCSQICSYCNFNKYRVGSRYLVDSDQMFAALVSELQTLLKRSSMTDFTSIYFGGGTPSLAGPALVDTVLSAVTKCSRLSEQAEVTLEANPLSADRDSLRDFRAAGVNRLSLGLQSLNDNDLKLMNRDHNSTQGMSALSDAKIVFPGRVNVDIIFGRPGQTLESWAKELDMVVSVVDNHLSLYQLTVERGTPLAKDVASNKLVLPNNEHMADFYDHAIDRLAKAHYRRYEVSNFAKLGYESNHNISYWNGVDYLGIGPGAHSRFQSSSDSGQFIHCVNALLPRQWVNKVSEDGAGTMLEKLLTKRDRLEEVIATCLRTINGLTAETFQKYSTVSFSEMSQVLSHEPAVEVLCNAGLLLVSPQGVKATSRGLNVLDSLLSEVVYTVLEVEEHLL